MADGANKSVARKMGVKAGVRAMIIDAPKNVLSSIDLPSLEMLSPPKEDVQFILLFTKNQGDLDAYFEQLKQHLGVLGSLWVCWPKAKGLGTDLSLPHVIRIGYSHGLVESKAISIDSIWSALKFTHPKPGKKYDNSFGTLPDDQH